MTEEDTFRILTRSSFWELFSYLSRHATSNQIALEIIAEHGWTKDEYITAFEQFEKRSNNAN